MTDPARVLTGLADYTQSDLEALESQRPGLGRVEVIDDALHATGGTGVGNLHQLIVQRMFLLLAEACPVTHLVRLDTWWRCPRGWLRPDLAIYRAGDEPTDRAGAFEVTPQAVVEVLSADADHDLRRKDPIYAEHGIAHRVHVDPDRRYGWWIRVDGGDHDTSPVAWRLPGWPRLDLRREELLDA